MKEDGRCEDKNCKCKVLPYSFKYARSSDIALCLTAVEILNLKRMSRFKLDERKRKNCGKLEKFLKLLTPSTSWALKKMRKTREMLIYTGIREDDGFKQHNWFHG